MLNLNNVTSTIQSNTILNRGLLDVGGVAVPNSIMSNNSVESSERAVNSGMYFILAFLTPFVTLPLTNRFALSKLFKVTKNFSSEENHLIRLSNKYLTGTAEDMKKGISELSDYLLKHKKIDVNGFKSVLDKFKGREEELRQKLVNAKSSVWGSDFWFTGVSTGSIVWVTQEVTKQLTGRTGFSAKYEMADESHTKKMAEQHEKNKWKKYLCFLGFATASAIVLPKIMAKSMLAKNATGIFRIIKENAQKLDYKDGKFMSMPTYFSIFLLTAFPGVLLASRDSTEKKDWLLRLTLLGGLFFGGDALMNGAGARISDKLLGTQLIDREKLKSGSWFSTIFPPVRKINDLDKVKGLSQDIINRTKKSGAALYWGTLFINMLLLGFGMPYFLNKIIKKDVEKDLKKMQSSQAEKNIHQGVFKNFYDRLETFSQSK